MSALQESLKKLTARQDLSEAEAEAVMEELMSGAAEPAVVADFLVALRTKGETAAEITGFARIMREKATRVHLPFGAAGIDTCGTGGDGSGTFNVSTAAALIVAACGLVVAKHGNRSVSSKCGSADVLAELGVRIDAPVPVIERCLKEARIGFLFAPALHGAMKHVMPVRKALGVRTVFNILGPLTNPAFVKRQLIGVFDAAYAPVLAAVLGRRGSARALVVHGAGGLDEVSLAGPTQVAEWDGREVKNYEITPDDFGLPAAESEKLTVAGAKGGAAAIREVLAGKQGPRLDFVLANAAAALVAGTAAKNWQDGVAKARKAVRSGEAGRRLEKLVQLSNG